jgi:FlaA1/EpsC-like NDP-sugar epimerase
MKTFLKLLDILRIAGVAIAFYWGYQIGYAETYNPIAQLHFIIPVIIVSISGISGFEGLFFGKESAKIKGFEVGNNYQIQSAIALLSYAVISVFVYFSNWGIQAELTILFTFMFFFFFSAINHAVNAVKNKNYKWQNVNRPFLTLLLIAGLVHPVIVVLKSL